MSDLPIPDYTLDFFGGSCPVQGDGAINGQRFYFRARGTHWSLGIGGDEVMNPEWLHEAYYGPWPSAGWMDEAEAKAFMEQALARFAAGLPGERDPS